MSRRLRRTTSSTAPSAAEPGRPARALRRLRSSIALKLCLSLSIFVVGVEGAVRCVKPTPRRQIVRSDAGRAFVLLRDGVPVWHLHDAEDRWRTKCLKEHPDARPIVAFGSSIFYGVKLKASEVFTAHLQTMLDDRLGEAATCVMNFAQPGYGAQNSMAEARWRLRAYDRPLVLWQSWDSDRLVYTKLGAHAYNVQDLAVDEAGYPNTFPAMPQALHHWLFRHSHAYEYAALAFCPERETDWRKSYEQNVISRLDELPALVQRRSGRIALFMMPYLDRPLRDQLGGKGQDGQQRIGYQLVTEWAERSGIPTWDVAELLSDQDVQTIRRDTCCHFNSRGHEVLAERISEVVLGELKQLR